MQGRIDHMEHFVVKIPLSALAWLSTVGTITYLATNPELLKTILITLANVAIGVFAFLKSRSDNQSRREQTELLQSVIHELTIMRGEVVARNQELAQVKVAYDQMRIRNEKYESERGQFRGEIRGEVASVKAEVSQIKEAVQDRS